MNKLRRITALTGLILLRQMSYGGQATNGCNSTWIEIRL